MTSADFCPIIPCVTGQDAVGIRDRPVGQISPDKSMNFHYTTPAFTVAPELRASLCCANSPRAPALYAVSVRGLIASESRSARLPALGLPSDPTSRLRPCRRLVLVPMKRIVTINRVHVQGTYTPLVHAHARRTPPVSGYASFLADPDPGVSLSHMRRKSSLPYVQHI